MLLTRVEQSDWLSNAYLVFDEPGGKGVLVDSNTVTDPLAELAEREGIEITHLLLTHHHYDHVVGARALADRFGAPIVAHELTDELIDEKVDETFADGEVIETGDLRIEVMHTPGHCADHCALAFNGTDVLTADVLFKGTVGGTRAPGATGFADLKRSVMERLMKLPPETRIHPGHREPSTIGDGVGAEPVRPHLARARRRGLGELLDRARRRRGARAGDADPLGARLRRRQQGLGAVRRRFGRDRRRIAGEARLIRNRDRGPVFSGWWAECFAAENGPRRRRVREERQMRASLAGVGKLLALGAVAAALLVPPGRRGGDQRRLRRRRRLHGAVRRRPLLRLGADPPRSTVPAWDGVPIDVNVAFPPEPASGPDGNYPLMMMFHGYGGEKLGLAAMQRWLDRGYATFSMTDRGFHESCGSAASQAAAAGACANGYVRLIDNRYEVRDAQEFAGQLADEGLIDPQQIGAIGGSYGGGMSMALGALRNRKVMPDYSLVPWTSPDGKPMQIAAAAPNIPWTDLAYSLQPNGSTLDYVADAPYRGRIGVEKQSLVGGLYFSGLGGARASTPPRAATRPPT